MLQTSENQISEDVRWNTLAKRLVETHNAELIRNSEIRINIQTKDPDNYEEPVEHTVSLINMKYLNRKGIGFNGRSEFTCDILTMERWVKHYLESGVIYDNENTLIESTKRFIVKHYKQHVTKIYRDHH